jgi:hypothetical protein
MLDHYLILQRAEIPFYKICSQRRFKLSPYNGKNQNICNTNELKRERIFHIHTTGKKPYLFGKSVVHMEHQFFSVE